jgi:hypothetical protein
MILFIANFVILDSEVHHKHIIDMLMALSINEMSKDMLNPAKNISTTIYKF